MKRTYRNPILPALGLLVVLAALAGPSAPALAKCFIGGEITAERNHDPQYPAWKYTAVIEWDTVSQYALSHLDILIDTETGSCTCYEISSALTWWGVAGHAVGEEGCEVDFEASIECNGDPSIPDLYGILLKFEPISLECEPGPVGTLTVFFYSEMPPAPIDEEVLLLFDKFAGLYCSGYLSGYFPSLACNPVDTEPATWDVLKSLYR